MEQWHFDYACKAAHLTRRGTAFQVVFSPDDTVGMIRIGEGGEIPTVTLSITNARVAFELARAAAAIGETLEARAAGAKRPRNGIGEDVPLPL